MQYTILPRERVNEESDDGGGGEGAGEVDACQDVEAGFGDDRVVLVAAAPGGGVACRVQGGKVDPGAIIGAAHLIQLSDVNLLGVLGYDWLRRGTESDRENPICHNEQGEPAIWSDSLVGLTLWLFYLLPGSSKSAELAEQVSLRAAHHHRRSKSAKPNYPTMP